jgi:hypothetical protein
VHGANCDCAPTVQAGRAVHVAACPEAGARPPNEVGERALMGFAEQLGAFRRALIEQSIPADEAERYVTALLTEMLRSNWRK